MISAIALLTWMLLGALSCCTTPVAGERRTDWLPVALFFGPIWLPIAIERRAAAAQPMVLKVQSDRP